MQADATVTSQWLVRHLFSFEIGSQRQVLSSIFAFDPDGTIDGYDHPNERVLTRIMRGVLAGVA